MRRAFKFSLYFIIFILLSIYILGFYVFSKVFLPNSRINGKDVSFTKLSEFYNTYNSNYDKFELTLIERDGREQIKVSDFDYKDKLEPGQSINQKSFYWAFYFLIPKDYELKHKITYDREKLEKCINKLKLSTDEMIQPKDAKIIFKNNKFIIEKEVLGNRINRKLLLKKILDHVYDKKEIINLEEEKIYISPNLYASDVKLNNLLAQMNKLNSFEVTYNFDDRKEILKNEELVKLYVENKDGLLVPDIDKVKSYVYLLSNKYDTFRKDRNFYATGIGMVRTSGGIYGWSTNIDETTKQLVKALEETKTVTLEPVYKLTAQSRKKNDLGSAYIEIDLARQHMWLYKDGKLIMETDIVSGNPSTGNATPTGVGKIWTREKDRFLTGDDYKSHVNYWLPFNWSGCGLHDSDWRSEYGKDLYITNGSHGCINTPPDLMHQLFENTFVGMPVVVYDSNTQIIPMNSVQS